MEKQCTKSIWKSVEEAVQQTKDLVNASEAKWSLGSHFYKLQVVDNPDTQHVGCTTYCLTSKANFTLSRYGL
jgi:hypothetical protein